MTLTLGRCADSKSHMTRKGHSGKTQHNRLLTVTFLLKTNGLKNPLSWKEFPTVEEDPAIPFEPGELKKLFAAMSPEDVVRYNFFLKTGAREKEVSFASWADVDLHKGVFHVRAKPDVGFTPKSHESRSIPMPASLVTALKERKKAAPHPRWIFANRDGKPEGHFLRKLKLIAFKAGLNCGHCTTETSEMTAKQRLEAFNKRFGTGKEFFKKWEESSQPYTLKRTVSCADAPVCSHWYLHQAAQNVRHPLAGRRPFCASDTSPTGTQRPQYNAEISRSGHFHTTSKDED